MAMRLYLLPGLGADARIFNELDCGDALEVICLDWIPSTGAKSMADYARMMHEHYQLEPPYALGGVSLGGMIAQEWAQLAKPEALVLISTATSREDMAALIRVAASMKIGPYLSKPMLTALGVVGDRFTKKSPKARALFLEMLENSDADLLTFGAAAVLDWQPPALAVPYLRIHGTVDKVFPFQDAFLKSDALGHGEVIKGGNHFMIFEKGKEIGGLIAKYFEGKVVERSRLPQT